ncbi:MAG TPA: hypothetical protein VGG75_04565 [Trebonia sp.]
MAVAPIFDVGDAQFVVEEGGDRQLRALARFDHAAHRLAVGGGPALVAAEGGYVDQSHLHRDAAEFAGLTPAAVAVTPFLAIDDVAWPQGTFLRDSRPPRPGHSGYAERSRRYARTGA